MSFSYGQVLTLEQIKQGAQASVMVRLADADLHLGDLMDLWLFHEKSHPTKLKCFIAGFTIIASSSPTPLVAVQLADSLYYVVIAFGAGTICQPGEISLEHAEQMNAVYWAGMDDGGAAMRSSVDRNSAYSHTRAPQPQTDRSGRSVPQRNHKSHLSLAASKSDNKPTQGEANDGQAQASSDDQAS